MADIYLDRGGSVKDKNYAGVKPNQVIHFYCNYTSDGYVNVRMNVSVTSYDFNTSSCAAYITIDGSTTNRTTGQFNVNDNSNKDVMSASKQITASKEFTVSAKLDAYAGGWGPTPSGGRTFSFTVSVPGTYSSCTAPTSFSISPSVIAPRDNASGSPTTVYLSWSGASGGLNNPISYYNMQYAATNTSGAWGSWVGMTASSTDSWSSGARGCYVKYRIQTVGSAGTGYASGWKESNSILVNSEPSISGLGSNKSLILTTGENVRFSWSASDANGHGLSYYYVLNTTSNTVPTTGSSRVTNKYVDINVGSKADRYFHVRAWDGYEYSSALHYKLPYNTLPGTPTISSGWSSAGTILTNAYISFSATDADTSNLTYYVYRQVSSTTTFSSESLLSTTTNKSYTDSLSDVSEGYYVRYRVRAWDGYEFSSYSSYTTHARKNISPNQPTSITITPAIFESSVNISWGKPAVTTSALSYAYVQKSTSPTDDSFTVWNNVATVDAATVSYIDTGSLPSRGYYVKYRVRYSDSLGVYSSYVESATIKRNTAPVLSAGTMTYDFEGTYLPWEKNSIKIEWAEAVNDDSGAIKYTLSLTIPGFGTSIIFDKSALTPVSGKLNSVQAFVSGSQLTSLVTNLITSPTRRNEFYSGCYFSVTAYDSFEVASNTITKSFNIDFRSSPILPNQSGGIGTNTYYFLTSSALGVIAANNTGVSTQTPYSQSSNLYPMLNSEETIVFTWPKGTDFNNGTVREDDITSYTIYQYYSETIGLISDTVSSSLYSSLVTLNTSDLTLVSGKYSYTYTIPDIQTNRVVKFAITAKDTTSKTSNFVKFPYGVEFCRTTIPAIELDNIGFGTSATDLKPIKSTISILDIGGSAIDSSRSGISYANRRNLERILASRRVSIDLEYSNNVNFTSFSTMNIYNQTNAAYEYNMSNKDITSSGTVDSTKSYFVRLKITVFSNTGISRTSLSNVIMLRGSAPPISIRKIGLGLNIGSPNGRFHVRARENTPELERAIFGDSDTSGTQRFIISLIDGSLISGIIDCGELV